MSYDDTNVLFKLKPNYYVYFSILFNLKNFEELQWYRNSNQLFLNIILVL